jgi:heme-degrading monooxygenase HmoA
MFVRIWRFRVAAGHEQAFEQLYGSSGAWAQLFGLAAGFLGTTLQRAGDQPSEYLTVDRWESRDAWEVFRRDHALAYDSLDRLCDALTVSQMLVREQDEPTP